MTLLTLTLQMGIVDIFTVITWEVNGLDDNQILDELKQRVQQAKAQQALAAA